MKKLNILLVAMVCTASAAASDMSSYYACGNLYTDVPIHMQAKNCEVVSVQTGTVVQKADPSINEKPLSLAEQQAQINNQIAEQNKKIEEANLKAAADAKQENCKAAQMNRDMVEKTNARNKNDLLPKYEADIAKYCN